MDLNPLPIEDFSALPSPGLVVCPERVKANLCRMIDKVGGHDGVGRLRPHLKTHKMAEVTRMQVEAGITKAKVATTAEAEMAAGAGVADILLAHQPVGPKVDELARLAAAFPEVSFAAVTDDADSAQALAERLGSTEKPFRLFIDVDCGMGRTGVPFGEKLDLLRTCIESTPGVTFAGIHLYDGHLHSPNPEQRFRGVAHVASLALKHLEARGPAVVVVGGSPTFGTWASETDWECSPGTTLFWDVGYGAAFPDLDFQIAAALVTRVVSKPGSDRLTFDLGYKAVAAEKTLKTRVLLPDFPDAVFVGQSEEHLVVETAAAANVCVGDAFQALPFHVCPTVALHDYASILRHGKPSGEIWPVTSRRRRLLT